MSTRVVFIFRNGGGKESAYISILIDVSPTTRGRDFFTTRWIRTTGGYTKWKGLSAWQPIFILRQSTNYHGGYKTSRRLLSKHIPVSSSPQNANSPTSNHFEAKTDHRSRVRRPTSKTENPPTIRDFQAEMLAFQTVCLVALLVAILPICLSHPSIRIRESERRECRGCGNECDKCIYGVTISALCGVLECRKGPNERCGGHNNVKGVCGEGMLCQCERCTGCSIDTLKCSDQTFDEPCRPRDDGMNGYWDTQRNNWFTLVK